MEGSFCLILSVNYLIQFGNILFYLVKSSWIVSRKNPHISVFAMMHSGDKEDLRAH